MMKSIVNRLSLGFIVIASVLSLSCDSKPTSNLTLEVPASAIAIVGPVSNCADIRSGTTPYPKSATGTVFKLANFVLNWTGTNELYISTITVTIAHPFIKDSPKTVTYTDIEETFGADPIATGRWSMNDGTLGTNCSFVVSGFEKTDDAANRRFSANAKIEFRGYSQNTDGSNAAPVESEARIKLEF